MRHSAAEMLTSQSRGSPAFVTRLGSFKKKFKKNQNASLLYSKKKTADSQPIVVSKFYFKKIIIFPSFQNIKHDQH